MNFLKHAEEPISSKELCTFVSGLPDEALANYLNTEYQFRHYVNSKHPDHLFESELVFMESKLYSVGKMNAKILFVNVLSKRKIHLVHKRFPEVGLRSENDEEYPFLPEKPAVEHKLVELARKEAPYLDNYYYMSWVLHDETLDKDIIIAIDDVIFDNEIFIQVKALVFDWQYRKAVREVNQKYECLLHLKSVDGRPMIPVLEQLEENVDETN